MEGERTEGSRRTDTWVGGEDGGGGRKAGIKVNRHRSWLLNSENTSLHKL